MLGAIVYNKQLEPLGVLHNWQIGIMTGEMSRQSTLNSDCQIFLSTDQFRAYMNCHKRDEWFPKLLIQIPEE